MTRGTVFLWSAFLSRDDARVGFVGQNATHYNSEDPPLPPQISDPPIFQMRR